MKPEDLQDRQKLEELEFEQLVELVLELQKVVQSQGEVIEKLSSQLDPDRQTSSKPPSSDLPKRAEKAASSEETATESEPESGKRRPGGQPGHKGKTRKGFGRVDRNETHQLETCPHCGGHHYRGALGC